MHVCLTLQGLKKYHVHNDIFRYQEERYSDEVSDETGEGTIGKSHFLVLRHS